MSVGMQEKRRQMPGAGRVDPAAHGIVDDIGAAGGGGLTVRGIADLVRPAFVDQAHHQIVEPRQHLIGCQIQGRQAVGGGAQPAHGGHGAQALARHVPDLSATRA